MVLYPCSFALGKEIQKFGHMTYLMTSCTSAHDPVSITMLTSKYLLWVAVW
jgi:hypothetical protein